MKQCPRGHIYDEKRNKDCPYCRSDGSSGFQAMGGASRDFPRTVPVTGAAEEQPFPATMPADSYEQPSEYGYGGSSGGMSVTVALDETPAGISPVKGWLVAVDGEKAGICFNIHGEQNSIGRGSKFDINISYDNAVSSDGNAVIAYDSRNRKFFLSPVLGKGKNNLYVNDSMLLTPLEIKDYDRLLIGSVTYVFRSFCNESFTY